jgi:transcriptional regulator with XRE-family HTH domain
MAMLRRLLGDALRRERLAQHRTLREVSSAARVSLGYLSEVERGQKEASSELLASICEALEVRLSNVLREVSDDLALAESADLVPADLQPAGLDPANLEAAELESVPAGRVDVATAMATATLSTAGRAGMASRVALARRNGIDVGRIAAGRVAAKPGVLVERAREALPAA